MTLFCKIVLFSDLFLDEGFDCKAIEATEKYDAKNNEAIECSGDTMDEKLCFLKKCSKIIESRKAKYQNKDAVVFIGATGSGKSTTINALIGCEMKRTGDNAWV